LLGLMPDGSIFDVTATGVPKSRASLRQRALLAIYFVLL